MEKKGRFEFAFNELCPVDGGKAITARLFCSPRKEQTSILRVVGANQTILKEKLKKWRINNSIFMSIFEV